MCSNDNCVCAGKDITQDLLRTSTQSPPQRCLTRQPPTVTFEYEVTYTAVVSISLCGVTISPLLISLLLSKLDFSDASQTSAVSSRALLIVMLIVMSTMSDAS